MEAQKVESKALDVVKIKSQILVVSGALQLDALYQWSVIKGARKELVFEVPNSFVLTNVVAEGFEVKEEVKGGVKLLVLQSPKEHRKINVRLKGEISVEKVPSEHHLLLPIPQNVLKSSGDLYMRSMIPVKVITTSTEGLIRVENKTNKGAQLYTFPSLPIKLGLKLKAITPVVDVSSNHDLFVQENDVRHLSSFKLDVREAPLNELSFRLQGDFIPVSVKGVSSYEIEQVDGHRVLRVRLPEVRGSHNITIEQERAVKAWSEDLEYPSVTCLDVRSQRGLLNVGAIEGFAVELKEVKGLLELPKEAVAQRVKNQQSTWRFREFGWGTNFSVKKLKPRIKAEALHMYSLGESAVYVSSLFTMKISAAPTNSLVLAIPKEIKNPEIEGDHRPQLKKMSEGTYEVLLNKRISGNYNLLLSYDLPSNFKDAELACGGVSLLNAESESGYITLSGSNTIRSQSFSSEDAVFQIEEKLLPEAYQLLHSNPLIDVFRYTSSPHRIKVKLNVLDDVDLLGNVIASSVLKSTLLEDGSASHKATFMVGNRNKQFLTLMMKEGSFLGRCLVEGEVVQVIADGEKLLIPLKRNTDPNKLLKVELTWTSKQKALDLAEDLNLSAPQVDAVTLHSEWELNLPKDYILSNIESNILPQGHYERGGKSSWLDSLKGVMKRLHLPSLFIVMIACFCLSFFPVFKGKAGMIRAIIILLAGVFTCVYMSTLRIEVQHGVQLPQEVYTFRSMSLKELAQPYIKAQVETLSQVSSGGAQINHYLMLLVAGVLALAAFIKRQALLLGVAFVIVSYTVQTWSYGELVYLSFLPLMIGASLALFSGRHLKALFTKSVAPLLLISLCLSISDAEAKELKVKPIKCLPIPLPKAFSEADVNLSIDQSSYHSINVEVEAFLSGAKGDVFHLIPERIKSKQGFKWAPIMSDLIFDEKLAKSQLHSSGALSLTLNEKVSRMKLKYNYVIQAVDYSKENQAKLKNEEAYFSEKLKFDWSFLPNSVVRRVKLSLPGQAWQALSKEMLLRKELAASCEFSFVGTMPKEFVRETLDANLTQPDFYAEQEVKLIASEGVLSLEQNYRLRLMNGILPSVNLVMPEHWQLESVESLDSKKKVLWDYDAKKRDLKLIFPNSENEKNISFKITSRRTNLRLPQKVQVHLAHLEGARSVRGRMIVASKLGMAMRVEDPKNCRKLSGRPQIDFATEPESDLSAWQFSSEKPSLSLSLSKVNAEYSLYGDHQFHLSSNRLSLNSNLQVNVKKSGVFKLQLRVPQDYEVENVQCESLSYWDVEEDGTDKLLSLFLNAKLLGQLKVQLSLVKIVQEIPLKPRVPQINLVGGGRQTGSLRVTVEKGFKLELLESQNTSTPKQLDDGSQNLRLLTSDWEVTFLKKSLEASRQCEYMQTMRLEDNLVKGMMKMDVHIENSPVKTLKFTSAQALDNLDIRGKNIARLRTIDKKNWELDLLSPQIGKLSFEINWQKELADKSMEISPLKFVGASRQMGHLIFYAASNISLKYENQQSIKKIDFREIDSLRSPKDIANSKACFKSLSSESRMKVKLEVKSLAQSLPAEIKSVQINTQVGIDASQISSLKVVLDPGTKPYLKLVLPKKSRLVNVNIDQETVRPMQGADHVLIPLKSRPKSAKVRDVTIDILYINENQSSNKLVGPAFDLPLNQVRWNLFMPENHKYDKFTGNMKYLESYAIANLVSAQDLEDQYFVSKQGQAYNKKSIDEGLKLSKQGRNVEARIQLEQVVEESLDDKGKQEDAKMQLNRLWRTQAQMAINNRRENLLLAGKDLQFNKNYSVSDVRELEQSLKENDSSALGSIGEKIFSRQKAARKRVQALAVNLPKHGKHLEFHREMLIDREEPLIVEFQTSEKTKSIKSSNTSSSGLLLFLSFLTGLGMLVKLGGKGK